MTAATTAADRRLAAQRFADEWRGRGQEDKHDQTFWNQLLSEVMGVPRIHHEIDYQKRVTIPHHGTKRIDAYIPQAKVLIEQKSNSIDLDRRAAQSDGEELTAYEQAVRYAQWLPLAERPDWIVVSNFATFRIYDTREDFNQEPICVTLDELPEQLQLFDFLTRPITDRRGCRTWVSIEPYPTPNLIEQDIEKILEAISFTDRIIFRRTNYSKDISAYKQHRLFYNEQAAKVISSCNDHNISFHIKKGTVVN